MSLWSLFKADYPYDRGSHGILMRYLQNFRYFTFIVTVLWFLIVLNFRWFDSTFSIPEFVILITIDAIYMVTAEITMYLTYSRCPESAGTLIKLLGIADITIVTSGVFLSGGALSPFVLMYLFPLANFRIVYGNKSSFIVTGICLAEYFVALMASPATHPLGIINLLTIVAPCFFAFTYYFGLILKTARDSRMESVTLGEAYQKSKLLYNLSRDLNQSADFQFLCVRVFEAIEPVIKIKGMKVFFDEDEVGTCNEIYSYETEQIDWSVKVDYNSPEELGPEVLQSVHCDCGFFVLPLGKEANSGMIVIRGSKDDLDPEQYEVYLKTVAEITAASFRNAATLKKLKQQSVSDGLTGLLNKRYFSGRLEETVSRAKRYRMKFVVAMLDIDHFKAINDKYGHVFGDMILKKCAQILQEAVRGTDLIARYGGEEFCVIMPHTDIAGAENLMERVRKLVQDQIFEAEGETCRITVSIGLASWKPHLTATEIVKNADRALYDAKNNGRNKVVCESALEQKELG